MNRDMIFSMDWFTLLFHFSNLLAFLSFLLRDQLQLRLLMAVSLFLQGMYYFALPGGPLFDPLFWKVVSFVANVGMILLVFGGRLDFGIPADLRGLFEKISVLSPGQFRRLIAHTQRHTGAEETILKAGQMPARLYFLLKGQALLIKTGQRATINPGVFLGEIAFLNNTTASGTVVLHKDAECISWDSAQLRHLMRRDKTFDIAMRGIFNSDLAQKVANSLPLGAENANSRP